MALQTISLKGKNYVPVNVRIQEFRSNDAYKGYALLSEVLHDDGKACTMKAVILNPEGKAVSIGHAKEYYSTMNAKYIENCETSAWGRALANLGIGIDESIASYQEMQSFTQASSTPKPSASMQEDENSSTPFASETEETLHMCQTCGSEMKLRSGTNKTTGKSWKAYMCESGDRTHKPLFV